MKRVIEILFGSNMEKAYDYKISSQLKHIISLENEIYRQRNSILAGVTPKNIK